MRQGQRWQWPARTAGWEVFSEAVPRGHLVRDHILLLVGGPSCCRFLCLAVFILGDVCTKSLAVLSVPTGLFAKGISVWGTRGEGPILPLSAGILRRRGGWRAGPGRALGVDSGPGAVQLMSHTGQCRGQGPSLGSEVLHSGFLAWLCSCPNQGSRPVPRAPDFCHQQTPAVGSLDHVKVLCEHDGAPG